MDSIVSNRFRVERAKTWKPVRITARSSSPAAAKYLGFPLHTPADRRTRRSFTRHRPSLSRWSLGLPRLLQEIGGAWEFGAGAVHQQWRGQPLRDCSRRGVVRRLQRVQDRLDERL